MSISRSELNMNQKLKSPTFIPNICFDKALLRNRNILRYLPSEKYSVCHNKPP